MDLSPLMVVREYVCMLNLARQNVGMLLRPSNKSAVGGAQKGREQRSGFYRALFLLITYPDIPARPATRAITLPGSGVSIVDLSDQVCDG